MKNLVLLVALLSLVWQATAQVSINDDNSAPDPSAMLDVRSSDKGFLPPRMTTTQMNGIVAPVAGLLVYNTSVNALYWYNGINWQQFNEFNFVEQDPVFALHPASSITIDLINDWNTAYGWGNHALAGYLTSYTETDPIFGSHPAYNITQPHIDQWNAAYSWGNHALAGYLTSFTETDPVFLSHPASSVSEGEIANWNFAYGWGNHALMGYLTNYTETDPIFNLHPASGLTTNDFTNWNTAYSWGNHALAGYLTSYTETDPLFYAHPASWISTGDINNWNQAYANRLVSVHGSTPLSLQLQNNQLTGSIQPASAVQSGYLTANDWNTFNNKQSQLTFGHVTSPDMVVTGGNNAVYGNGLNLTINKGSLTETYSSVLTITGGANAVLGTGTTIRVNQATSSQSGYLSSADWNTFNNKQNALTFGNLTSSDITVNGGSSAVKGSGTTLTINKSNLTSTDITVTGGTNAVLGSGTSLTVKKGNLTESGSSVLSITNGSNAVLGTTGTTLQVKQAGASQSGYLSSGDWNIFNDKVSSQWTSNGTKLHYNTGNVGIGTSDPQNKISIAGNATIGSSYSSNTNAPENGLLVEGQVGVGTSSPSPTAKLEISSTNSGLLLPRMTLEQIETISSPANGLVVFCTTNSRFYSYLSNVNKWRELDFGFSNINPGGGFLVCGDPITVNHVSTGGVAPVNKTASYGTVTNIPGETSKCWITSNLGSTYEANIVNDTSEASHGWYWQFNRKQGYKHNGTNRIPNTIWIASISENTDWQTANDPCNLELGTQWRLPSYTEWYNVDNAGGWITWNGPWRSGLKLHAAGYLNYQNGNLSAVGAYGNYWCTTQNSSTHSWDLHFGINSSNMGTFDKAHGFTVRCLRDN